MRILYAGAYSIYKNCKHASGQLCYDQIVKLSKEKDITIDVFHYRFAEEGGEAVFSLPGINSTTVVKRQTPGENLLRRLHKLSGFWLFSRKLLAFNHQQTAAFKTFLKDFGKSYDIVFLQWTEMIDFLPSIRRYCPRALIILGEQDVKFQVYERLYKQSRGFLKRFYHRLQHMHTKRLEIKACNSVDFVVCHNLKDKMLLSANGVKMSKITIVSPSYSSFQPKLDKHASGILFFGAMNRLENETGVLWFINNVFYRLPDHYELFVVGNKPSQQVLALQNDRIHVTGFVKDPTAYFEKCFCMVVPLFTGAGIKIKTLQGMASGLPVISTSVGMEGIPARDKNDFLLADDPVKFINSVNELYNNAEFRSYVSANAKNLVSNTFSFETTLNAFLSALRKRVNTPVTKAN